jgi:3alpha(or 20beta)-hydroxysteroid dehydrogenase
VNSLHPGFVGTPAFDRLDAAQQAIYVALQPMGRPARPSEIADAALFLSGEESAFMTGAELLVDGGYTAQ